MLEWRARQGGESDGAEGAAGTRGRRRETKVEAGGYPGIGTSRYPSGFLLFPPWPLAASAWAHLPSRRHYCEALFVDYLF